MKITKNMTTDLVSQNVENGLVDFVRNGGGNELLLDDISEMH